MLEFYRAYWQALQYTSGSEYARILNLFENSFEITLSSNIQGKWNFKKQTFQRGFYYAFVFS